MDSNIDMSVSLPDSSLSAGATSLTGGLTNGGDLIGERSCIDESCTTLLGLLITVSFDEPD